MATNPVMWPALPCYNNLVVLDQLKQLERMETIGSDIVEELRLALLEFQGALQLMCPPEQMLDQIARLADEVIPAFHSL